MVRTQIYLTEQERQRLADLARTSGRKQSELIQVAIDQMLAAHEGGRREAALKGLAGVWRDRDDLPDFPALRREFDRAGRR